MSSAYVETMRRVYAEGGGPRCIEVGPDADGLAIEVRTSGAGMEFFGPAALLLPPAVARALGEALIAAAGEVP